MTSVSGDLSLGSSSFYDCLGLHLCLTDPDLCCRGSLAGYFATGGIICRSSCDRRSGRHLAACFGRAWLIEVDPDPVGSDPFFDLLILPGCEPL
ncbi:MAG: hypothetical protein ACAI34_16450 [Verrucomicrobium sp.]